MCGIFGVINHTNAAKVIIEALKRLEYRGYDSAGIVTVSNSQFHRVRVSGKVNKLEEKLLLHPIEGSIGIGHTRWATHGIPNENNAHPHTIGKVTIVHNGIIENYLELKRDLQDKGYKFLTETDSEIIAGLISYFLDQGLNEVEAVSESVKRFHGNYAICALFADNDQTIIGAKNGSPLSIGIGEGNNYFGSDTLSLSPYVQEVINLEDGDIAILQKDSIKIIDKNGTLQAREAIVILKHEYDDVDKGLFPHFMIKEIFDQPRTLAASIKEYFDKETYLFKILSLPDFQATETIDIIACGTSFFAANVTKYWFEEFTSIKVSVDIGSEYRYRPIKKVPANSLAIFISQSGETADTLASLKYAKELGYQTLSIINVPSSSMARISDYVLFTKAGPEIGVASTKAFTSQLITLITIVLKASFVRKELPEEKISEIIKEIFKLPLLSEQILDQKDHYKDIARKICSYHSTIYLARGLSYPIAAEGALKLKELSYIHAEAFPAGELKHGPIALIDDQSYIVAIALNDRLFPKTLSNLQEVYARNGRLICVCNEENIQALSEISEELIKLPKINPLLSPIISVIPLQLIAYYAALNKGHDVDKPRNLAKSVTVE